MEHALRVHAEDAGAAVALVGADAGLGAGERDGGVPAMLERHGEERGGDDLAGGEQEVEFARLGFVGHLLREGDQVVGGFAHGGDDDDEAVAAFDAGDDARGDGLDALGVGDGGAAVLLDGERAHVASAISAPSSVGRVMIVWPGVSRERAASSMASAMPCWLAVASAQMVEPPPER